MPPPPYRPPRPRANLPLLAALATGVAVLVCALGGVTGALVLRRFGTAAFSARPAADPSPHVPAAADFTLTLTILSKHCYGSAGCNIAYRVTPAYTGSPLARGQQLTVVYVVTGGDSGPQTDSFGVRGDQALYAPEQTISTSSSAAALAAVVTQVLPG